MTCSLIITTYNWKEALELVLLSALGQTIRPDEIIIADDGSDEDTKILIENIASDSLIPIIHSWQEDDGFRASASRNKAIAKANGDYIVLIDGDIILEKNFIKDHKNFAKQGYFVQGIRAKLSNNKAKEIFANKQFNFKPFENGIKNKRNSFRNNILSVLFSGKKYFNKLNMTQTCNMAFFKTDCLNVNGFNEDFIGWGKEDSEFAARLLNNGIQRRDLRYKAIGYHIHHEGNSREMLEKNKEIYQKTIQNKLNYCKNGIDKYLT